MPSRLLPKILLNSSPVSDQAYCFFIVIHCHSSFILISFIAFLFYGPPFSMSLKSRHFYVQLFCGILNLPHSLYFSIHFISCHFIFNVLASSQNVFAISLTVAAVAVVVVRYKISSTT
jgi:hypothetical protein